MEEKGFLYVATGRKYVEEAIVSYKSIKLIHPGIPAVVYTDRSNFQLAKEVFESVEIIEDPSYNFCDKIIPLASTPFEKTLFVDSDTYLNESIDDIWSLLNDYDFACTQSTGKIDDFLPGVPKWFCELSTGIILYRNNERVQEFLRTWNEVYLELYNDREVFYDQASFRQVLWDMKPNFFVLPQEYNFSTYLPNVVIRDYPVKIFHGRYKDFKKAVKYLGKDPHLTKLFIHDFRFVTKESVVSFNYGQSNNLVFRFGVKVINILYRSLHRLFPGLGEIEQKKKGA